MLLSDSLYFDQPLGLSLYQISNSGLKSNSGVKMYSEVSDYKTSGSGSKPFHSAKYS